MSARRFRTVFVAALLVATSAGCGRLGALGGGGTERFFATRLCGVQLDGKTRTARLHLTLSVLHPLPQNALVETEFHNPVDRSTLTATQVATGNERTLEMLSPPIQAVRARSYETVTRVYASAKNKKLLGQHTQLCESLVDQRELPLQFR